MFKELSKTKTKLAKQMGLTGSVKPGDLLERRELLNSGKLKLPTVKRDPLTIAEKHLSLAERHLKNYHK